MLKPSILIKFLKIKKKLTYELAHEVQQHEHIRKVHVPHVQDNDDFRIRNVFHIRNVKIELGIDPRFHKLPKSPKMKNT